MTPVLTILILSLGLCLGFPWKPAIPIELKGVTYTHDEEHIIRKLYEADENGKYVAPRKREFALHQVSGQNCGSKNTPILVNKMMLPDVILLGGKTSVAMDVTISKDIPTASLLSVVAQKKGIPVDIPCMDNIGTCNYTDPCEMLKNVTCPPSVQKAGWNCRCPLFAKRFNLPATEVEVPSVEIPAILVDGVYSVKVQLFNGREELLCYALQVTLKEK